MGMLRFTIRISSSKLLKGSCSPEAGKVTVPCHSPCSIPVTEISNKGAFFMGCWLLLWNVCAGMGAPYRTGTMAPVIIFCIFLILSKEKILRYCPFYPQKRVMPPGLPGGIFLSEHILLQVVPVVDPQLFHGAGHM